MHDTFTFIHTKQPGAVDELMNVSKERSFTSLAF